MDKGTISNLSSNLLLLAKEEAALGTCNLVADPSASFLYENTSFLGRSWCLFYDIVEYALGTELRNKKYVNVVEFTAEAFKSCMLHINSLNETLQRAKKENLVSAEIRSEIISTGEAFSLLSVESSFFFHKELSLIKSCFNRVLRQKFINNKEILAIEKFGKNYAMIALEGILQKSVPTSQFSKLLKEEELSFEETYAVDSFIESINSLEEHIPPWLFHLVLQEMAETDLNCDNEDNPTATLETLFALEELLHKRGLRLIMRDDPQITELVENIAPGDCLDEENRYVVGNPIFHPSFQSLSFLVFENSANPQEMLVIGKSFLTLGIWKKSGKDTWAIPTPKILMSERWGRYFVIEKLEYSLDERPQLKKFGSLSDEDKRPLDEIARLVAWLASQDETPENLTTNQIFFTSKNRLRTFVALDKKIPFNYEMLEKFCISASNKNYLALCFLMKHSRLFEHPIGQYYFDVIKNNFLEIATFLPVAEAAKRQISDPAVIDRAKKLIKAERDVAHSIFLKTCPLLKNKKENAQEKLKKEIIQAILQFHIDAKIPASLWHEAESRIIDYLHSTKPELFYRKPPQELLLKNLSSFISLIS